MLSTLRIYWVSVVIKPLGCGYINSSYGVTSYGVKSALDSIKYHTRVMSRLDPFAL